MHITCSVWTSVRKSDGMNKRWTSVTVIVLILVFAGYIILDTTLKKDISKESSFTSEVSGVTDQWKIAHVFDPGKGQLNSVAVSENGYIFLGGELFAACYDPDLNLIWEYKTEMPVTALAVHGSNIYAGVQEIILVLNLKGEKVDEWGPFESNSIITSLAANETYVAFADAANKTVFLLDKEGSLKFVIGKSGESFIIPSLYFDVALGSDNILYAANTGNRRIEKRNADGSMLSYFGEPGIGPGDFCGCCNPSHFTLIPGGFVTSEKGINRIKILDENGGFVEFVSSVNNFLPPLPLDVASADGKVIYGANPADSKLYVFTRK
jgi:hypothetical protein